MKVRIAVVTAALLACSGAAAFAQAPPAQQPAMGQGQGAGGGRNRRMAALLEGITLTPQQQATFDSIQAAYRSQMPAFTPGQPMDSTTRAHMMELRQKQDADLRAVLTADQQAVWDRNLANMPRFGGRRPN